MESLAEDLRGGVEALRGTRAVQGGERTRTVGHAATQAPTEGREVVAEPSAVIGLRAVKRTEPRRLAPEVVTEEPAVGDEEAYGEAWPLVEDWRLLGAGHPHQGKGLPWLVTEERLLSLELAMLEEHGLTLPPETEPLRGFGRSAQVNWRRTALEDIHREEGLGGTAAVGEAVRGLRPAAGSLRRCSGGRGLQGHGHPRLKGRDVTGVSVPAASDRPRHKNTCATLPALGSSPQGKITDLLPGPVAPGGESAMRDLTPEELREALDHLNALIMANPDDVSALAARGQLYRERGDDRLAAEDFGRVIGLAPRDAQAHHSRGLARAELGEHRLAIEDYDMAVATAPGKATAYADRGVSRAKLGDHSRAIEDFDTAIRLDPGNARAYFNRGSAYADSGDPDSAVEDLSRAIDRDPDQPAAYHNRGLAFRELGDFERAIEDFSAAVELEPLSNLSRYNRAVTRINIGQFKSAVRDLDAVLRIDRDNADALRARAVALGNLGRRDAALKDLNRSTVAVSDEEPWLLTPGGRLDHLPPDPGRDRVLRDVPVPDAAPAVVDRDEHVERAEGEGLHREQVSSPDAGRVVAQKRAPRLTRRSPERLLTVAAHGASAHVKPSARSSPTMRTAPHRGFSVAMRRISRCLSAGMWARPGPRRLFQRQ